MSAAAVKVGLADDPELAAADLGNAGAVARLRDELEQRALAIAPDAVVLSAGVERLPNTSCIAVPGAKAETLVIGLDLAGIAVSSGAACSSGKVEAVSPPKAEPASDGGGFFPKTEPEKEMRKG